MSYMNIGTPHGKTTGHMYYGNYHDPNPTLPHHLIPQAFHCCDKVDKLTKSVVGVRQELAAVYKKLETQSAELLRLKGCVDTLGTTIPNSLDGIEVKVSSIEKIAEAWMPTVRDRDAHLRWVPEVLPASDTHPNLIRFTPEALKEFVEHHLSETVNERFLRPNDTKASHHDCLALVKDGVEKMETVTKTVGEFQVICENMAHQIISLDDEIGYVKESLGVMRMGYLGDVTNHHEKTLTQLLEKNVSLENTVTHLLKQMSNLTDQRERDNLKLQAVEQMWRSLWLLELEIKQLREKVEVASPVIGNTDQVIRPEGLGETLCSTLGEPRLDSRSDSATQEMIAQLLVRVSALESQLPLDTGDAPEHREMYISRLETLLDTKIPALVVQLDANTKNLSGISDVQDEIFRAGGKIEMRISGLEGVVDCGIKDLNRLRRELNGQLLYVADRFQKLKYKMQRPAGSRVVKKVGGFFSTASWFAETKLDGPVERGVCSTKDSQGVGLNDGDDCGLPEGVGENV
jgi:hypothetical protein